MLPNFSISFCDYLSVFGHPCVSNLKGKKIADRHLIVNQLADDTLFLRDTSQIALALKLINSFSRASGLCLNINKCDLLAIKYCPLTFICEILVKTQVTYLRIIVTKDSTRCPSNFSPVIDKTQKKLNAWLQRDLSLKGRILLSKVKGLFKVISIPLFLKVDSATIKKTEKMLLEEKKNHYIKKICVNEFYVNSIEQDGMNLIDFTNTNFTKLNNTKIYLEFFPSLCFFNLGGLKFLLVCNYDISKIPVKLSNFHKQKLLSWSLIFKHNFKRHSHYI